MQSREREIAAERRLQSLIHHSIAQIIRLPLIGSLPDSLNSVNLSIYLSIYV